MRSAATMAASVAMLLLVSAAIEPLWSQARRGGPTNFLKAADVQAVIAAAASVLSDTTLAVAVVDRKGTILGVYRRNGAAAATPDLAVSLARTTAYFSNDQAPLSSRTVRTISGIHFPPGIKNTANAALYGVENINRGCELDPAGEPFGIDRPRSLAGTPGGTSGPLGLTCNAANQAGCSIGITTGKNDLEDKNSGSEAAVNPGALPLYREGHLIGGVGVAGVSNEKAQFAALIATQGAGRGITTALAFPSLLPTPGAIYIDGIRLPFYGACSTNIACIQSAAEQSPAGASPGSLLGGSFVIPPVSDGGNAPEGYLCCGTQIPRRARGSNSPDGLTAADVTKIVDQAIASAESIRAQVRLPFGQTPTFVLAVTDETGRILAEYRMEDALFDAVDVVPSKARNAYYFSTPEGYAVLKRYLSTSPERYTWTPDLFPPGIDGDGRTTKKGPWFDLFLYDTRNPCTEGDGPSRGGNRSFFYQNGITWFPGSAPLYKNGKLVGGLGVSGDGVEQNDLVTAAGAAGFEPPPQNRVDNSVIVTATGATVPLPYLKFPRNPTDK
jgi:uncharacterized protein GlcG (DUF336 family)